MKSNEQSLLNIKRKRDTSVSENNINLDIDLKEFLSIINILKNMPDYAQKGPYIYCVVKRNLNIKNISSFLNLFDQYHVGLFECTKEELIHYGEKDNNGNRKPLIIDKLTDEAFEKYTVIKYFYSKEKPENFINLIDKKYWITEFYDQLYHNCIHCVNEFLILNGMKPINFGAGKSIAYEYLCDNCYKELGRDKIYKYDKNGYMDDKKTFYDIEDKNEITCLSSPNELNHTCERCLELLANWKYDENWQKNTEEEDEYLIDNEITGYAQEYSEKYRKIGKPLSYALIRAKLQNYEKNQYAIVRKNLIDKTRENERNYGFVALVSLHENKIIEYGNEKYNKGSPVVRVIELEDQYLYHLVRTFQLDKNINEFFYSINLGPWTGNRYDIWYYNSYNFINIYLNKYNQKLIF